MYIVKTLQGAFFKYKVSLMYVFKCSTYNEQLHLLHVFSIYKLGSIHPSMLVCQNWLLINLGTGGKFFNTFHMIM